MNGATPLPNPKYERFALLVAQAEVSSAEAYRECVSDKCAAKTSHERASRLCADDKVKARIEYLRGLARQKAEERAEKVTLSMAEKQEFLARIVKCKGAKLDEEKDGDLINGVTFDQHGNRTLKIPDKLAALKLHNDLVGEGAEKIEIVIRKL